MRAYEQIWHVEQRQVDFGLQVLEVHGNGFEAWMDDARRLAPRVERVGDTAFAYAADIAPLLADLRGRAELSFLHRPASLEDVFLKLTGRDLRD